MKCLLTTWHRLRERLRRQPRSRPAPRTARLAIESLEDRRVLSSTIAVPVGIAPFSDGAPWAPTNDRDFVAAQSVSQLQSMYFNTPAQYRMYVHYFQGVLHSWVVQADNLGITDNAGLSSFLGQQLAAKYQQVRHPLAALYPEQSEQTYALLMAMNLVSGYYQYGTAPLKTRSLYSQLHLKTGSCAQIAELLKSVVLAEGIQARELVQSYNYATPHGRFVATHAAVYAGGLWLDAEINTAFRINLRTIGATPPNARLPALLASHAVFGFYNWYLQPHVRATQLVRGLDGGILSFYYQNYFAGIGQGQTKLTLV
jgi:hypothetical protein